MSVNDQAAFAAEQREPIDQLLFIVYALLGLAVVIAVLGIVNTLALSVIERIREIGLLRAVGLSRRQLRTMLRLESVAIALLGAVLGIVLGLAFALALQRSLADDGIDVLAIPGGQLALFVAIVAGSSACSPRSGPAAGRPGSTCSGPSRLSRSRTPPVHGVPGRGRPDAGQVNMRVARASASAYWAPAAPSTCPIESSEVRTCCWVPRHWATTPWNWADADAGPRVLEAGEPRAS